ncbi:hypothetical protein BGZ51_006242 [Haplosporangium sp. Z 767]|nr:hypothetical protein BGZ50_006312 [Haplosporangium sp. Z 11]KAF9180355.1 hypothetical protein BGZ51_006242 [Haplosporangium sp. Z 767]
MSMGASPVSPSSRQSFASRSRQVRPESSSPSKALKRDSSLPLPLPIVLPALPPLIPVATHAVPPSLSTLPPIAPTTVSPTLSTSVQRTDATGQSENVACSPVCKDTESSLTRSMTRSIRGPDSLHNLSSVSGIIADADSDSAMEPAISSNPGVWPEQPREFLERVKETVSKAELGDLLSKGSDSFHQAVLRIHMESFDFRRDPIDLALRKFLLDFHFPKEAQQIDRVLEAFASRYHACNPHLFRSSDVVYTIAFSLMLLHTDSHNKNVRYKMTKEQYVRQAKTIDGVNTIPADILEVLYDNITFLKFVYAEDELDVDGQRIAEVQPTSGSWFNRRRTASSQRADSYSMIRHGSIGHLAPDLSDLIPFRWPYYWKGTIEMVDNVQINNQFTRAPLSPVPGLCSRRHSQQFLAQSFGNTAIGVVGTVRPELMQFSDTDPRVQRAAGRGSSVKWNEKTDGLADSSCAELKIVKYGILIRKIDIEHGKKSAVRGWRDLGVILSGSQLLFFTDLAWFQQQRSSQVGFNPQAPPEADGYFATELGYGNPPLPQALISTSDSIAVVDSSYQKYPHVFRLVCPNGKQYLFRAESEREMNDWMAKINYASAFKTAGIRLRCYRVTWASDVVWIKDEQGRHQLRRRQYSHPSSRPEMLDGRAQLIQAKLKDIDRQINTCSASLAAELRLARGLEVMIPLQNTTRQKIVQSATVVGKRLRHLMLERTKLDCFRTILERDLAVVPAAGHAPGTKTFQDGGHGMPIDDNLSGTTQCSPPSVNGTVGSGLRENEQKSMHWRQISGHSGLSMDDHLDLAKEEYVLDSSRASQSSNRSSKGTTRPRLIIPSLQRTASENALGDQERARSAREQDITMGPAAIQAAIIDAARGAQGCIPSTMSSPDPNHYQRLGHSSSGSTFSKEKIPSTTPNEQSLLSPESSAARAHSRSRALSMPGQRPILMPRTVSIYSSSSQTASRLKKIFEQGLGHLKWKPSTTTAGSSLKGDVLLPPETDRKDTTSTMPISSSVTAAENQMDFEGLKAEYLEQDQQGAARSLAFESSILSQTTAAAAFTETIALLNDTADQTESEGKVSSEAETYEILPPLPLAIDEPSEVQMSIDLESETAFMDSNVDNGEDEVTIDNSVSSSPSLEQSFILMAKSDYVKSGDDDDDDGFEDDDEGTRS